MAAPADHYLNLGDGARLRLCHWPPAAADGQDVLVLPGRTEPAEKYAEVADDLRQRGHGVWCLDWRGQGRSTRFGRCAARGHAPDFDGFGHDLAQVLAWIADRRPQARPPLVLAHSMGAGIALRLLQMRPGMAPAVAGLVLTGPMIRIPTRGWPPAVVRRLAHLHVALGRATAYVVGAADWGPRDCMFDGNRRTRCRTRFEREVALLTTAPELRVGGPTWGWVQAALRLSARMAAPWASGYPDLPIRVVVGGADSYVPLAAQHAFFNRFPDAALTVIDGARHEVLMETDDARAAFWQVFDNLVRRLPHGSDRH